MRAPCWPSTSDTSMAIVHIRASINVHTTTTWVLSCRWTRPYGDDASSAASSTSTTGRPDPNRKGQVTAKDGVLARHRVRTCRRELLDRTLVWNQRHLLHVLRQFEISYNEHRPHQHR